MLNKVHIIGRLGRDVEIAYSQSGQPVGRFTVATDESYSGKNGQRVEATEWHRVVVFGNQAETCSQYIAKGSLVFVEGRIRTRKWTSESGQERQATEIHADRVLFLDRKKDQPKPAQPQTKPMQQDPAPEGWDEFPF